MAIVPAVPTCLLLVLTGLGVADRAADWGDARGTEAQVGVLLRVQDLVREMQRERMAEANALLSGSGSFLTAPTRFLGHHVVGTLASRLGAHVGAAPDRRFGRHGVRGAACRTCPGAVVNGRGERVS
jgi:hypothetical protein